MQRNIAIMGRSGAGKTTAADILVERYGYHRCTPGGVCRRVCDLLFGAQDRARMNRITDLLKEIDPLIWLKAAMLNAPAGKLLVYDSMRFAADYEFFRDEGFEVWKIEAADALRHERLAKRGQAYSSHDEEHALELELQDHLYHALINNNPDISTGQLALKQA